jgi:hypothetical protein
MTFAMLLVAFMKGSPTRRRVGGGGLIARRGSRSPYDLRGGGAKNVIHLVVLPIVLGAKTAGARAKLALTLKPD